MSHSRMLLRDNNFTLYINHEIIKRWYCLVHRIDRCGILYGMPSNGAIYKSAREFAFAIVSLSFFHVRSQHIFVFDFIHTNTHLVVVQCVQWLFAHFVPKKPRRCVDTSKLLLFWYVTVILVLHHICRFNSKCTLDTSTVAVVADAHPLFLISLSLFASKCSASASLYFHRFIFCYIVGDCLWYILFCALTQNWKLHHIMQWWYHMAQTYNWICVVARSLANETNIVL